MTTLNKSDLQKFSEQSGLQVDGRSEFAYTDRLEHFSRLVRLDLELEIDDLKDQLAKAYQLWQIAEGRCDALMQQRDDLLVAQQWQPITTAPKEGLFLVHRKHTAYPIVAHVYKPYGSICDYVFGELLHNVTHWMPLPPAPAIASVKEKS